MFRRCLIPTLNVLTKTAKPHLVVKINDSLLWVPRDVKLYSRSFATTNLDGSTENLEIVTYEDVKSLANNKNVVLIDVREPNELVEHGVLPGSINIPLGEVEETLKNMSNDQFFKTYGCSKPNENTPVVFSCMKGVRSQKAQITALKLGYKNVKNYMGGWTEWAEEIKKAHPK